MEENEVSKRVKVEVMEVEKLRLEIHNWTEWKNVNERVTELVIPSNCCNEEEWSVLDVSELKSLKSIEIGDWCFAKTQELKLIGLKELERVRIGHSSFAIIPYNPEKDGIDPYRHFYLNDCERLRELRIGYHSFMDYSVCEIESVPSLEVIEMGNLKEGSASFYHASLIMKSDCSVLRMMNRHAQFEISTVL